MRYIAVLMLFLGGEVWAQEKPPTTKDHEIPCVVLHGDLGGTLLENGFNLANRWKDKATGHCFLTWGKGGEKKNPAKFVDAAVKPDVKTMIAILAKINNAAPLSDGERDQVLRILLERILLNEEKGQL